MSDTEAATQLHAQTLVASIAIGIGIAVLAGLQVLQLDTLCLVAVAAGSLPVLIHSLSAMRREKFQFTASTILILSLVLFPTAEVVRTSSGWPINRNFYPPVAGPGDTVRTYFPNTIVSLEGYWNGVSSVTPQNDTELGPPDILGKPKFRGSALGMTWGQQLRVESNAEKATSVYTDIIIRNDPALAGKTAMLDIQVDASFPKAATSNTFSVQKGKFQKIEPLALATPLAGANYTFYWWAGLASGIALQLLSGALYWFRANRDQ